MVKQMRIFANIIRTMFIFGMLCRATGAGLEEEVAAGSALVEVAADVRFSSVQRVGGS